jgi:hypothetical protein
MNCIFVTIFTQEKYIDMFYILFESLLKHGLEYHVLVYTSSDFMNKIKSKLTNDLIRFKINDSYNTIDKACRSKLDFFNLSTSYSKVLYLDTDCVVTGNINGMFDMCTQNVIYAIEEGRVNDPLDFWGKSLFEVDKNITAFSSSILLFNNCEQIKELFRKITVDMGKRYHYFCDQPFIVYQCVTTSMYDNKLLTDFLRTSNIIYHAAGGPGENLQDKLTKMNMTYDETNSVIHVGSSNENVKRIKLNKKVLVGHNLLNPQDSWWSDTFDIRVVNNEVVVKRTDTNSGWGQDIVIPIKYNKILIYNGFPFYYDRIGCILDFCKQYSIDVDIVMTHDTLWMDAYKTRYTFTILPKLPPDYSHYLFVVLLAENDPTFPSQFINANTVCIYKNTRLGYISDDVTFPVFRYINLHDKLKKMPPKPIITCMGDVDISFITNLNEFDLRRITSESNVLDVLASSTYMVCENESQLALSFSTGCKLIIPKNGVLFKSSIEYEEPIMLDPSPSLFETFNEREELIHSRDTSILNLPHMKLFLDFKTIQWR